MTTNASHYYYIKTPAWPVEKERYWMFDLENKKADEFLKTGDRQILDYEKYFKIDGALGFPLEVIYPGLLIGAGYSHPSLFDAGKKGKYNYKELGLTEKKEISQFERDIKTSDYQLGFFFDHTTGLPVIPGSTVKGILKNAFPYEDKKDPEKVEKYAEQKLSYINDSWKNAGGREITAGNWKEIFFNRGLVFLDAYIKSYPADGLIFADDFIAPHNDAFKNPIPIRFLKIRPGVKFWFQFLFPRDYEPEQIKAIKRVFKQIILDFGICAKRNVGYGAFKQVLEKQ